MTSPLFGLTDGSITPRTLAATPLVDFTGGLQLTTRPFDNEVLESCNIDFRPDGGFCRRDPIQPFGDELPAKPCGICFFENRLGFGGDAPFPRVFVPLENGEVWSIVYMDDGTLSTEGPFSMPDTQESDACYRCKQINFRQYFYNGEDCTVCVDGLAVNELPWDVSPNYEPDPNNPVQPTPVVGMPKAEFFEVHNGFAWAANVIDPVTGEERCNRVWRSWLITDGEGEQYWGEGDWIDIDAGVDGDCIVGMIECGDELYVFKTHSVYRMTQGADFLDVGYEVICQDVGAVNCDAIACCDCRLWFFDARKGLQVIDQGVSTGTRTVIQDSFGKVQSLLDDDKTNCELLPELVRVGCCNGRVYVSMPSAGSTENDVTYVFDPELGQTGAWTKYDVGFCAFGEVCPSEYDNGIKDNCLAATTKCNGLVALEATTESDMDDFGCGVQEPIYTKLRSRWYDGQNPWVEKKWCTPEWIVQGEGAFKISVSTDYGVDCVSAELEDEFRRRTCRGIKQERLTPGAEPTEVSCTCGACELFDDPCVPSKYKLCGPQLNTVEGCTMAFCIEGPPGEWCVCGVMILYLPEALRC